MKYRINFVFDYIFPTFILPNATMPEIGVVNYLTSMHSLKAQNATSFEQYLPISHVFDNELGAMPNSNTGYFYQAQVYSNVIGYEEKSLYIGARAPQSFIYPIKPSAVLGEFFGIHTGPAIRMNGEFFWKYISKKATEYIKSGRCKIFIDYSMEPFIEYETFLNIHKCLELSDLPNGSIIMCVNSFNARELYEKWFDESEQRLQIRNLPFCLDHSSWYYKDCLNRNTHICMSVDDFNNTKNVIRDNHFLMKIRNSREHRAALLYKLVSSDLLKFADWSFLTPERYNTQTIETIINEYKLSNIHVGKVKNLYDTAPHLLQSEQNNDYNLTNAWTDASFEAHSNSYFEVCFETYIRTEYKSLTEKIFKPIANFQPFLFIAYPGALQLLRDLGFKTFDGFIDESYDLEIENSVRIEKIYKEIERLSNMSKDEIHNWYWGMEDILIHNHNTLINYNSNKIFGEDLIKEMHEFTRHHIVG